MLIKPFKALRPNDGLAPEIASLPYDVMDSAEARAMALHKPLSFLHVVRSEIDLEPDVDPASAAVYDKARANLNALFETGKLIREQAPSIYIYRQVWQGVPQTAVVACCAVDDYVNGRIKRHELTRRDKEDDRTNHILVTKAQTGQVFLCYRDLAQIDALVAKECESEPLYRFTAEDGVEHIVWRVGGEEELIKAFEAVPEAYIADGHHRSAASCRAALDMRAGKAGQAQSTEADFFMACLFPASQLRILPYHRCVRDLNGLTPEGFLKAALARGFSAAVIPGPENLPCHSCAVRLASNWYRLSWQLTAEQYADSIARLDVSRLQEDLLAPVLGIGDPRTDPRIYFVGGIRGTAELERDCASGKAAIAFAMRPTTIEELMMIADDGAIMPPKSTWFEPKLRSGLLIHEI